MSWESYIDKLMDTKYVSSACIGGHDGSVWAKSEGFHVTQEELTQLIAGFDQQNIFESSGVKIAGKKYVFLSGTDQVIRARLGCDGVHCMRTDKTVVVSTYEQPIQPQQIATVVEKLGDFLINSGY